MRVLFLCARNKLRSSTAEAIFGDVPGLECSSAGTAPDAECVVSTDLIEWADCIFTMEKRQATWLKQKFKWQLRNKRVVCLSIPDTYTFMQDELVAVLRARVLPRLVSA